ncbi:MAG: family 1 extracellular solute-binding protein [Paenibacillus sp.]|jgi:multiple sugar transport system substrate-binding protein|nr:family 1 extracellular solute-binding protein [Paenibacillus sp.]
MQLCYIGNRDSAYSIGKFEQKKLEVIQSYGTGGQLYGLPDNLEETSPYNTYALIYSKDIFDKFAVPYPQDNMTWDQTIDLARKFIRTDGGTEHIRCLRNRDGGTPVICLNCLQK